MNTKALIQYLSNLDINKHHVDVYAFDERVQHKHPINQDLILLINDLGECLQKVDVFVVQGERRRSIKSFSYQNDTQNIPNSYQDNTNFLPNSYQDNTQMIPKTYQNHNIQTPNLGGLEGYLINDLKEKNRELKTENKDLLRENKQLERENFELKKSLELKEKDFEIERIEIQGEAKNGLNGFLESAAGNEQIMTVLGTVLGRLVGTEQSQSIQIQEPAKQEIEGKNTQIRQNVDKWLAEIEEGKAKDIYKVLMLIYKSEGLETQILQDYAGDNRD